jgi:PqqD family protein of HPr-rel-A system
MKDGDALPTQAATAWRVPLDAALRLRCWKDEYVVYNPLTGNTHLLDIVAGELLVRILEGVVTTDQLCRHIARFLELPEDEHTRENVAAILAVLDDLELIEPVEP